MKKVKRKVQKRKNVKSSGNSLESYTPIVFKDVERHARAFADHIQKKRTQIEKILLSYESYEVVEDEIERTLDILRSLSENKTYFKLRIGDIASFLPRNQPLYALTCFVLVPSYMASRVHFRIPHSMKNFMPQLLEVLTINSHYQNVHVSNAERLEFLRERSALKVDPSTHASLPVTDAVIFTGTPGHADQLRLVFDERTLFISNGAGHNPLIITEEADIDAALDAVLTLQLYNQGQDCAAPKSVLVHRSIYQEFIKQLREKIRKVRVGQYTDRSVRVGPISDPTDLVRIQEFLVRNRMWLDPATPGVIRARDSIVEPTIISKPLREGGNFTELFAPIIVVQEYEEDSELALYFKNPKYAQNAMYVTVYGKSAYITNMIGSKIGKTILHDKHSFLRNTHLHERGVERGTKPYGGSGKGASSYSIRGKIVCKATLPQRDIYTEVAKPLLNARSFKSLKQRLVSYSVIENRNVEKLLRIDVHSEDARQGDVGVEYIDTHAIQTKTARRYITVNKAHTYQLLSRPNAEHIARLSPTQAEEIRNLRMLVSRRDELTLKELTALIYALPHKPDPAHPDKRGRQRSFFQSVYQLLFGRKDGPHLAQFLKDADLEPIRQLLDM